MNDDYQYDYNDDIDTSDHVEKGSRLVNARKANKEDDFGFVAAFYLSSSPRLRSPLCTAALITSKIALR